MARPLDAPCFTPCGGVAEWLNAAVSKTVYPVFPGTRVRIPPPPPSSIERSEPERLAFLCLVPGFEPGRARSCGNGGAVCQRSAQGPRGPRRRAAQPPRIPPPPPSSIERSEPERLAFLCLVPGFEPVGARRRPRFDAARPRDGAHPNPRPFAPGRLNVGTVPTLRRGQRRGEGNA